MVDRDLALVIYVRWCREVDPGELRAGKAHPDGAILRVHAPQEVAVDMVPGLEILVGPPASVAPFAPARDWVHAIERLWSHSEAMWHRRCHLLDLCASTYDVPQEVELVTADGRVLYSHRGTLAKAARNTQDRTDVSLGQCLNAAGRQVPVSRRTRRKINKIAAAAEARLLAGDDGSARAEMEEQDRRIREALRAAASRPTP